MPNVYEQTDFLDMVEQRNAKIRLKGGKEIDPDHIVTDLTGAIEALGLDVGRLATILDELGENEEIGKFSALHSNTVLKLAELLFKQQEMDKEQSLADLAAVLKPALAAARERMALGAGTGPDPE